MGAFLASEKLRYKAWKPVSPYFSGGAKQDGDYKSETICYPFCLPLEYAEENLAPEIRDQATEYFAKYEIKWHDGRDRRPSTHLCDSQICCVNFLFPFADKPTALAGLLLPVYPDLM